jgi:hypothetical protein
MKHLRAICSISLHVDENFNTLAPLNEGLHSPVPGSSGLGKTNRKDR